MPNIDRNHNDSTSRDFSGPQLPMHLIHMLSVYFMQLLKDTCNVEPTPTSYWSKYKWYGRCPVQQVAMQMQQQTSNFRSHTMCPHSTSDQQVINFLFLGR